MTRYEVVAYYDTAAEALAAVSAATTSIRVVNADEPAGATTYLTQADLAGLARGEAAAPDPEEQP